MNQRVECDLSHPVLEVADIGRLKTLLRLPVLAGDTIEVDLKYIAHLTQLRRRLAADVKVDMWAFFCPYRYTYGQDWIDFIEKGGKEAVTFPTVGVSPQHWLQADFAPYPQHIWSDAANIYNHYFRDPAWPELDLNTPDESTEVRDHGFKIAHKKSWGTAMAKLPDLTDSEYNIDTSGPTVSVFDIQEQAAKGKQQSYRTFLNSRYREIIKGIAGKDPHDYSDNVPELIWTDGGDFDGYDINGTAGAEIGMSVGKGVMAPRFKFPPRLFTEHGTLYIMFAARIPPMWPMTKHYLDNFNRPFEYMVPVPGGNLPPVDVKLNEMFVETTSTESAGHVPAYQWFREHPPRVSHRYTIHDSGWQVLTAPSTTQELNEAGSYDAMFATNQLRHIQLSGYNRIRAWRPLPEAFDSIMGDI